MKLSPALAKKKKRYVALIFTYEERRTNLRERHGVKNSRSPRVTPSYRKEVAKINAKLKTWKRGIARINKISKRSIGLEEIEEIVVSFIGVPIKNINGQHLSTEVTLGKSIFYKYALENGFKGSYLVDFIGGIHRYQAQEYRKRFTNSFKTNHKNKEIWVQFKHFYDSCKTYA